MCYSYYRVYKNLKTIFGIVFMKILTKLIIALFLFTAGVLSASDDYPEWEKLEYNSYYATGGSKIAVNDRNELFILLPTGIFKSIDQGDNWNRLNMPDSLIYEERNFLLNNNIIAILGRVYEYNQNTLSRDLKQYIVISYDYGLSWKLFPFTNGGFKPKWWYQNIEFIDDYNNIWGYLNEDFMDGNGFVEKLYIYNPFEETYDIRLESKDDIQLIKFTIEDSTIFALFSYQEIFKDEVLIVLHSTNLGQTWDTLHSNSEGSIFFEYNKSINNYRGAQVVYSQGKLYITLSSGLMLIDIDNKSYQILNDDIYYALFKRNDAEFYSFSGNNQFDTKVFRRSRDTMKTWEDITYNMQNEICRDLVIDSSNNVYIIFFDFFRLKEGDTKWTSSWAGLQHSSGGYFQVNSKSEILKGYSYFKDNKWLNISDLWTECRVQYPQNEMRILPNDRIVVSYTNCGLVYSYYPFDKFEQFIASDSIRVVTIYNMFEQNQNRFLGRGFVEVDKDTKNYYYLESKDNCETWEILENAYLPINRSYSDGTIRINKLEEFLCIGDSAKVYLSNDKGKSWKIVHDESLNPFFENNENSAFVFTSYNYTTGVGVAVYYGFELMLITRDHGRTWTTYTNKAPIDPLFEFIYSTFKYTTSSRNSEILTDNTTGYFYAPTWGGIYRSTDSLRTFHNMSKGLLEPSIITELQLGHDGKLYAMNYMGLWRTKEKVVSSVEEESKPQISIGKYFNIYPNPAGDYITIQLSKGLKPFVTDDSPSNKGLQPFATGDKVQIFDVLGIEVGQSSMIDNTAHNKSQSGMIDLLNIDVSNLPAGVYFIRIGNKVEKFVKM